MEKDITFTEGKIIYKATLYSYGGGEMQVCGCIEKDLEGHRPRWCLGLHLGKGHAFVILHKEIKK